MAAYVGVAKLNYALPTSSVKKAPHNFAPILGA